MNKLMIAAAIGLALTLGAAHAAPHAGGKHADEKHAQDMQAGGKHDDAKNGEGRHTQANRMKTCSADAKAKGLKGDERKSFMSDCLRKKA